MNYTKGEWKAWLTDKKSREWIICVGENGDIGIAKTLSNPDTLDVSLLTRQANANLIAASPNMYEALKMVLDSGQDTLGDGGSILGDDYILVIEQALAKAEGKVEKMSDPEFNQFNHEIHDKHGW